MNLPEVQQQIGEMLRAHWDGWLDQEIPLLGDKTPRQAVRTADGRESVEALLLDAERMAAGDPARASVEKEILVGVRRQLKLDKPLPIKRSTKDSKKIAERTARVREFISEFGDKRLHDTYTGFALNLCDAVVDSGLLNFHRGRIEIWAAAMVYAIAQLNFLFSPETPNHLTTDELCTWFKVKKATIGNKASTIRSTLDIFYNDSRFCAPHINRLFKFFEDEHGFIHSIGALDPKNDSASEPLPLKPSKRQVSENTDSTEKKNKL